MKKIMDDKKTQRLFLLSEYGKQKLLGYADSFREIAKTLEEDFDWEKKSQDRADFTVVNFGKTAVCWQKT